MTIHLTKEDKKEQLATNEPFWKSEVQLIIDNQSYEHFQLLNEETVCMNQQIIGIPPLGSGFKNLTYFQTDLKESDTTVFFSLLFAGAASVIGGVLLMSGRHVKLAAYGFVIYVLLVNFMLDG